MYLGNFVEVLTNPAVGVYLLNTLLVAAPATAASITLGVLAGWVFAKLPFRGSDTLFLAIVSGMFFPPQIVLIPLFRLFNALRLLDTLWALIIVHTAMGIPICTLLMRNFFATVPNALARDARSSTASANGRCSPASRCRSACRRSRCSRRFNSPGSGTTSSGR